MRNSNESQSTGTGIDKLKWFLVFVLIAIAVCGNFYFSEPNAFYQPNFVVRIIGVFVLFVLALFSALTTEKGRAFLNFTKESRIELRKVVWPTRKEAIQTTLIIAVITVIVGLCLFGLDKFLLWIIPKLTTLGH